MKVIVTGGAGFIGSAVVRYLIDETDADVTVVDKLTYAANLDSLASVTSSDRFDLLEDTLEIVERLFTGDKVSYEGAVISLRKNGTTRIAKSRNLVAQGPAK